MSSDRSVVRDGVTVGLIAYAAVAAFYAAFDLLAARGLLHTVDLLGKAVFRGLRDPAVLQLPIEPDMGAIFWYNGLHLVMSLLIGMVVVRLIVQAEWHPEQARVVLAILIGGFVVTVVAVGALTAPIRPLLPWWSIVVANLIAVAVAGTYLVRRRPGVTSRLLASPA